MDPYYWPTHLLDFSNTFLQLFSMVFFSSNFSSILGQVLWLENALPFFQSQWEHLFMTMKLNDWLSHPKASIGIAVCAWPEWSVRLAVQLGWYDP